MHENGNSAPPEDEPTRPSRHFRPSFSLALVDPDEAITIRRSPRRPALTVPQSSTSHGHDGKLRRLLRRVARMLG